MIPKTWKALHTALAVLLAFGFCAVPAAAATGTECGSAALPLHEEPDPLSTGPEGEGKPQGDQENAEEGAPAEAPSPLGPLAALGAGLVVLGGAIGIGWLARGAMEGTARQPEAGGAIRTSMIIAAALIEGFTFFGLIVCILAA